METVEQDIRLLVVNVNSAGQNLASLMSPGQEDKAEALETYSDSVDALESSSAIYSEHSERMGVEGRDYFDEWRVEGRTYANPQIQALSEERRDYLSIVYGEIAEKSVGVEASIASHLSTLEQVRTYFSTDLTPGGIQAMTPVALDAIISGHALNNSLEEVLGSIGAVRYELASGDDR
jgi:hypothetical protein